jgi:hypothetical protein
MSVRDDLIDEYGRADTAPLGTLSELRQKLDAYRTEVLARAIGRLRAIPVDCTALTGPVWYGDGWNSAITCLEEIADYQQPDDEAYPGELQRLRALALGLRVAVLRKGELAEGRRLLLSHAEQEIDAREKAVSGARTAPDFFRAGRTYEYAPLHLVFRCDAVSTHPVTGEPSAVGWVRYHGSSWTSGDYSPAEYADGWLDVTGEVTA